MQPARPSRATAGGGAPKPVWDGSGGESASPLGSKSPLRLVDVLSAMARRPHRHWVSSLLLLWGLGSGTLSVVVTVLKQAGR